MSPAAGRPRRTGRGVALAILAALLSAFLLLDTHPTGSWEGKLALIPKGSPLPEVVGILREGGILPHPLAFRALVILTFTGRRLHYGEYAFPTPPSAIRTWWRLIHGDVLQYKVIVPPGANLYDVAEQIEEKKLATGEAFLAAAASPAVLRRLEIPGESAEGYLFPDTYEVLRPKTADEIIKRFIARFREIYTPELIVMADRSGMTLQQVVTLASIIEKETGKAEERPLVSSVFSNRLKQNRPLQRDPTVIYGMGERYEGRITRADLREATPYNTYVIDGMPPTPIAMPGRASISWITLRRARFAPRSAKKFAK